MSPRTLRIRHASGSYEVRVGPGVRHELPPGRAFVVADENVLRLHGSPLPDAPCFSVPPGEASKSLRNADALWAWLMQEGAMRGDRIVAFGGGVVGDLAGFVAATFHRGTPFVQLPTTLLSQVDSSVGGKVAIDHPLGKNLIGAFHPPTQVLADTELLASLPLRERYGGLAEIVKIALTSDPKFLSILEEDLERIAEQPPPEVIARAIELKAAVVEEDEHEGGLRRILNFGHTLGHGLEAATGYGSLNHGEAVVIGMRAAIVLSRRHAGLPEEDAARALAILSRFPPPSAHAMPSDEAILEAMKRDKKAGHFVFLSAIGEPLVMKADEKMLREAIEASR